MVDAGEAGGILDVILMRLAVYLEKADALQRKVKSAMTYPSVVSVVAARRHGLHAACSSSRSSPRCSPTSAATCRCRRRIVMGMSATSCATTGGLAGRRHRRHRDRVHSATTRRRQGTSDDRQAAAEDSGAGHGASARASVARFTRTLGTLISSGVPILDGLEITARTVGQQGDREGDHGDRARASARATPSPSRSSRAACSRPWWCR